MISVERFCYQQTRQCKLGLVKKPEDGKSFDLDVSEPEEDERMLIYRISPLLCGSALRQYFLIQQHRGINHVNNSRDLICMAYLRHLLKLVEPAGKLKFKWPDVEAFEKMHAEQILLGSEVHDIT